MRRTTIVIDDDLIQRAGAVLGTSGIKATIDRALEEVIRIEARKQAIEQLREMRGLDLDQPDIMNEAWR